LQKVCMRTVRDAAARRLRQLSEPSYHDVFTLDLH
jgi:hypothetical protein